MIFKNGIKGEIVRKIQQTLILNGYKIKADGDFGSATESAVMSFQTLNGLNGDGEVGPKTLSALGLSLPETKMPIGNLPAKPDFSPLVSTSDRHRVFGAFKYRGSGGGNIQILGDWAQKNIVKVHLPQIIGKEIAPKDGNISFHRLGAEQLRAMFDEWEKEGLHKLILTWAGSYVPRFQRGSATALSNHAFGTAFDINAAWNGLGQPPARPGKTGSVCELIEIAHKYGFYWGGHFSRPDGMHFEIAKIL